VEKEASLRLWRAAQSAGLEVSVLDDGDICAGTSSTLPGPAFNHAQGLRLMPQLLPEVLAHFDRSGATANIPCEPPAPGARPDHLVSVHACLPAEVSAAATPSGVVVRRLGRAERATWIEVFAAGMARDEQAAWRALLPHLLERPGVHPVMALADGKPAGTGLLHVKRATGLLRGGYVAEPYRGRGIQRALIAARAQLAAELECRLLASLAQAGSVSSRNLERMGLVSIATHPVYRYLARGGRA
jgi:GNAT superfamily N-acetyltransferase